MASVSLLGACRGGQDANGDGGHLTDAVSVDAGDGRSTVAEFSTTVNRDIDVLFVIDDSPSMLDKQTNLKNNFPNFINVLNTVEGGLPNVHLGVVTSDLGTKGAADATAGETIGNGPGSCSKSGGKNGDLQTNGSNLVSGFFINDQLNSDGSRTKNYTGTLADAFSSIASVGAGGCGFEQHIEAAKRALNNNPMNAGFLRPDAYLALVFVQDEDDCSINHSTLLGADTSTLGPLQSFRCNRFGHVCTPGGTTTNEMNQVGPKGTVNGVSGVGCESNESGTYLTKIDDYITFFKGLKSNPQDVVVAAIAGPPSPYEVELRTPPGGGTAIPAVAHSCSYSGANGVEVADPSTRMQQFLAGFPNRSAYTTICTQDLSPALTQIAYLLRNVIGSPCVDAILADVDPSTPGDQYDCIVTDYENYGAANQTETILPQCNNTSTPSASTNKPCWWIGPRPDLCPSEMLQIERSDSPSPTTHIAMRCTLE